MSGTKQKKKSLVLEVTDESFQAEVLKSEIPVLVDFWAPWCGPCRAMAPIIEALAAEYAGKLKVVKVNLDDHAETAEGYEIQSIPTFLLFKAGDLKKEIVGGVPKAELAKAIKEIVP